MHKLDSTRRMMRPTLIVLAGWALVAVLGCERQADSDAATAPAEVVLYTSVDETFARQIIVDYQRETGRSVRLVGDSEAGKTTGLVNLLRQEKDRPRADVFWSSEQSQTVLLAEDGLLAAYNSPAAEGIPPQFCDPQQRWTGFALRARVVAFDPEKTKAEELPTRWADYADPAWAGRTAIANPLFGTTRGHMAAMHALWGEAAFREFLTGLVDGDAVIADGNSAAVRKLIAGEVSAAFTDSDDVITAQQKGHSLAMIFPDMGDGGTMLIPNTVALVAGAPHPEEAKRLIDYLLSPKVEEALARSASANYPVRESVRTKVNLPLPPASEVSFEAIAGHMAPAIEACREILLK